MCCTITTRRVIKQAEFTNLKKQQLGSTEYSIRIPNDMLLDEARGKEGQHGFGIYLKDTAKQLYGRNGFIEIEPGRPIGGNEDDDNDEYVETVSSTMLNKTVQWKIRKMTDGGYKGYYYAAAQKGKLSFTAQAPTKSGLDSMITIVSTLHSQ